MQRIEAEVRLPKGAGPIDAYSRYYARDASGIVHAGYSANDNDERFEELAALCRELARNHGKSVRDIPFPCPINDGPVRLVRRGNSLWLADRNELPAMSGGGCGQINIEYEPGKRRFNRVECNGPY